MRRETWRRATTPFGKTFVTPSSWTIRCSDESRTNSLGLLCRDRQAEPSGFGTGRKGATGGATLTSVDGVLDHGCFSFIRRVPAAREDSSCASPWPPDRRSYPR